MKTHCFWWKLTRTIKCPHPNWFSRAIRFQLILCAMAKGVVTIKCQVSLVDPLVRILTLHLFIEFPLITDLRWRRWLCRSPPLPLRTGPRLPRWRTGAFALVALLSGWVQRSLASLVRVLIDGTISRLLWSQGLRNPPPPTTKQSNTRFKKKGGKVPEGRETHVLRSWKLQTRVLTSQSLD